MENFQIPVRANLLFDLKFILKLKKENIIYEEGFNSFYSYPEIHSKQPDSGISLTKPTKLL